MATDTVKWFNESASSRRTQPTRYGNVLLGGATLPPTSGQGDARPKPTTACVHSALGVTRGETRLRLIDSFA
jgi:hypothetical protein